tara:strand:- start:1934 stop:2554 length:621 start_codon:yes stop_codon:yes gene_type:complete
MQYTRKITDQQTGETFEINLGEHLPFTEAANELKIKRSSLIKVLHNMGLCQKEYDAVAKEYRHRLKPEAKERGLGYRIMGKQGPFDVLSPSAMDWIKDELSGQLKATSISKETETAIEALSQFNNIRKEELNLEGKVRWLMDHFPNLPVADLSKGLGVSRAIVHRYRAIRKDQLAKKLEQRSAPLENKIDWPVNEMINEALKAFQH